MRYAKPPADYGSTDVHRNRETKKLIETERLLDLFLNRRQRLKKSRPTVTAETVRLIDPVRSFQGVPMADVRAARAAARRQYAREQRKNFR